MTYVIIKTVQKGGTSVEKLNVLTVWTNGPSEKPLGKQALSEENSNGMVDDSSRTCYFIDDGV